MIKSEILFSYDLPTNAGGKPADGLTIKQCDAYDMADGSSFNLETFLDTCEVDKRFVSEDEYNRGLYPQIRPRVWKEYANREPRFYASVAFNGAFWALSSAQDGDRRKNFDKYGTTEVVITEEKHRLLDSYSRNRCHEICQP